MVANPSRKRRDTSFRIPDLLRSISEQMDIVLKQKLVPHAGELGTGREEIIREFLRKYLPKRFGISTGFVFDVHGNVSKQVDIVVYDNSRNPVFEVAGGKQFFPCESVVCVGEVKSVLTSTSEVHKAFENIRSVKILDRGGKGENFSLESGMSIDTYTNHLDQVFTFLLVLDRCVSEETMRKALYEYLWENPRHLWVNLCYCYGQYLLTYCCEHGVCPNPMDAHSIASIPNAVPGYLLLTFYRLLARAINVTSVSTFSYWDYLNGQEDYKDTFAYPFEGAPVKGELPDHLRNRPRKL